MTCLGFFFDTILALVGTLLAMSFRGLKVKTRTRQAISLRENKESPPRAAEYLKAECNFLAERLRGLLGREVERGVVGSASRGLVA